MLPEKTVQYQRPDGMGTGTGTGIGADAGSGQWTGEKRRKLQGLSPPRVSSEARTSSSSYSPAQGGQEGPFNAIAAETDLEYFEISPEELMDIKKGLKKKDRIFFLRRGILEDQEQREVYERLALYRLRAHKLSKKESSDKQLDDETLRKELPAFLGTASTLFRLHVDVRCYFERLRKDEDDGSVDWYFDPEFSKLKHLSDYQRLVLTSTNHDDGAEYLHWEDYRSSFTTYEMDHDYVAFCDEMSAKLRWLRCYVGNDKGSDEWEEMETRGANQAVLLATRFPEMNLDLVYTAYGEHIWSLDYDYWLREGWDDIFFAIWKLLVTEDKLDFAFALTQVSRMRLADARHDESMVWALNNGTWPDLKSKFDSCVKGIPRYAGDEFAGEWIANAVWKLPKNKTLHQYKKRKMEIAENIGLVVRDDCQCMANSSLVVRDDCQHLNGRTLHGHCTQDPKT